MDKKLSRALESRSRLVVMSRPTQAVRADFDRIALLSEQQNWSHNDHYHGFLLKHVPPHCAEALDLGCGIGSFSRALAARSQRVLALDLSPQMIRIARERSKQYPNIDFQVADALEWKFPIDHFDCIVSIATLHHLPMGVMLSKLRTALKANGTLLVLDLYKMEGAGDLFTGILAAPVNVALRLIKTSRLTEQREVRQVWSEHGRHDVYPTLSSVRRSCEVILPGARVRKHLLWRYSIVWHKS